MREVRSGDAAARMTLLRRCARIAALALAAVMGGSLLLSGSASTASAAVRGFTAAALTANGQGYMLVSSAGEFYAFGQAHPQPNPVGFSGSIVGVAVTADGQGALAVSSAGQFYSYGMAHAWPNITGSSGIVGVAVTADGRGAMAVSSSGQFYAYGTAHPQPNPVGFSGSIVGLALTADGQGALAVSSAGQFYAYGTAHPQSNPTGFTHSITSVAMTADGQGAVAMSDTGQLYAYGSARPQLNPTGFSGSMVGVKLTADGQGLMAMSSTGQVYAYGTAAWLGNGDPGAAAPTLGERITSRAIAENSDATGHRKEVPLGSNCNFYSGAVGAGPSCNGGARWHVEAWCADFAKWVWGNAGANTTGLGTLASSFKSYNNAHPGTWHSGFVLTGVKPGDAVVFNLQTADTGDDHVGIVTAVRADSVDMISGNFGNMVAPATVYRVSTSQSQLGGKTVSGYTTPVA